MIALLRDVLSKTGPTSPSVEVLRVLSTGLLVLVIVFLLGGQHYWIALTTIIGVTLGIASKYLWWHFRPPKPPMQPETRYTKH